MKQDSLDKLLDRVQPPQAPAWFEAKVLARLRREQEAGKAPLQWLRWTAAAGAMALFAALAVLHTPRHATVKEAEVFAALAAFENYQEEQTLWIGEEL